MVYILSRKCSGVKVKVDINLNSEVKHRYVTFLLKDSNKVFVLCYITTLPELCNKRSAARKVSRNKVFK